MEKRSASPAAPRLGLEDVRLTRGAGATQFPRLGSPSQFSTLSVTTIATSTPQLGSAATPSSSHFGFSPLSSTVQSPALPLMRPKTAGAETGSGQAGFVNFSKVHAQNVQQRKEWADMMMTGSPIEVVADDDTYMFPTPFRRPSTANNSAAASPVLKSAYSVGNLQRPGTPSDSLFWLPALASASIEEQKPRKNKTWAAPRSGPGMKPIRAQTARDFPAETEAEKPKLSRWKSLGGIFGKKKLETSPVESKSMGDLKEAMEVEPKKEETPVTSPVEPKQSSQGSTNILRNLTKRKNAEGDKRPKTRDGKADKKPGNKAPNPPLKDAPTIDLQIPDVTLERYSIMFKQFSPLPARSSSLLARRQANMNGDKLKPVPGGAIKVLDVTRSKFGHVRSATEPSPRSPLSPTSISQRLLPEGEDDGHVLPHISSLVNRPRPIRRTNTAPPELATMDPRAQKLSPTFEADEMDYDDRDRRTPTPDEPSSPPTPESYPLKNEHVESVKPIEMEPRKNSWEQEMSPSNDSGFEFITIGKRISENDILPAPILLPASALVDLARPPPPIRKDSIVSVTKIKPPTIPHDRPRLETAIPPRLEVAVARTLSVKRANSAAKKTIVRSPSVKRVQPGDFASKFRVVITNSSSASSTPLSATPAVTPLLTPSITPSVTPTTTTAPRPLLQSSYSIVNQAETRPQLGRKESNRLEIKKEIWGERRMEEHVKEHRAALKPMMCVVEDHDTRKSVLGLIETA